jgi:hypothetical protein
MSTDPGFEIEVAEDERFERRIFLREIAIVLVVGALIAVRILVG